MTEAGNIGERIDALEARMAYQDDTIEKLNAVVTEQWTQIDALKRQVARLSEQVDEVAAAGTMGPANERPPHY